MPEYLAQVYESKLGLREVRVQAEHAGAVAQVLGLPPAAIVGVRALQPAVRSRGGGLDLRLFSQELTLLLKSGIPLLEALETLREKDGRAAGRGMLESVTAALRAGQPLSQALADAPQSFGPLFSRLKVMAELDIGERRLPQDGRFKLRAHGRDIDFRLSIMPSVHGEDAVIRVLDRAAVEQGRGSLTLASLGFPPQRCEQIRTLARMPHDFIAAPATRRLRGRAQPLLLLLGESLFDPADGRTHLGFDAWCAAHPGQACVLWLSSSGLADLVCEAGASLRAPAARSDWARRVLQHYHGEAAASWAMLPWRWRAAWGVTALRGLGLKALQSQAAAHGVQLRAVRPLPAGLGLAARRRGLHQRRAQPLGTVGAAAGTCRAASTPRWTARATPHGETRAAAPAVRVAPARLHADRADRSDRRDGHRRAAGVHCRTSFCAPASTRSSPPSATGCSRLHHRCRRCPQAPRQAPEGRPAHDPERLA